MTRPVGHESSAFVVSVSGGKDSTATILAMREAGVPCRYVFADTGWEAPPTYEYLRTLEHVLGIKIDRVGALGGMAGRVLKGARFAARQQRWCTTELKVLPLRAYHDALAAREDTDTVSVLGIRAEESPARSALPEFEHDEAWGGYVWRPLIAWTVADVLAIHHRHGVPVNPLYKLGFSRVGCMPCIMASKEAIRLMAEHFPGRVDLVRGLEIEASAERIRRNAETPGRYEHEHATFFLADKKGDPPVTIDAAVAWSKTSRGGVQLRLIQPQPDTGCFRWGMCEPPSNDNAEPDEGSGSK